MLKLGMIAYSFNPSSWEVEAGEQPGLHSEFQASLEYRGRPCLKNECQEKRIMGWTEMLTELIRGEGCVESGFTGIN